MEYAEWRKYRKKFLTPTEMVEISNFEILNPYTANEYDKQLEIEHAKIRDIMSISDQIERIETIARNLDLFR